MSKKGILSVILLTVVTSIIMACIIVALLKDEPTGETPDNTPVESTQPVTPSEETSDPDIIDGEESSDEDVVVGEDGRTFGEIVDERASGIDKSTGTIIVPNSDLSSYDDSVREEVTLTTEEAIEDLVMYLDLFSAPEGFIMSETMDYYSNQFDVEDVAGFIYTLERLLSDAGLSTDVSLVRCTAPYKIIGEDYWRIGYSDKVYTLILQDGGLWLFDQGIPFDDSVRII